jgi:hypothetical protein
MLATPKNGTACLTFTLASVAAVMVPLLKNQSLSQRLT